MEKTRIRLNICGVEIIVSGDADRASTEQIAEAVRVRMQRILSTAYAASVEKAAVITAMNLCEELARQGAELEEEKTRAAELEAALKETQAALTQAAPAPVAAAQPAAPAEKTALRNPFRPDLGDQTGLVSFFAKE